MTIDRIKQIAAEKYGKKLTDEQAAGYAEKYGKLSDDELDSVSGGCDGGSSNGGLREVGGREDIDRLHSEGSIV